VRFRKKSLFNPLYWSPYLNFVPKIWVCIFFIFHTQRPFQNDNILVFWLFGSKLYLKNPNSWAIFDTKHVFFKNRNFYQKKFFGQNELTCSWAKSGGQTFSDVQYFRVVTICFLSAIIEKMGIKKTYFKFKLRSETNFLHVNLHVRSYKKTICSWIYFSNYEIDYCGK
jgi:hypothetical protein